jgi:hypothetical protein
MKCLANFLAQSGSYNTDKTFTVFKGGVTEVGAPGFPSAGQIALITYLELIPEEAHGLVELQLRISLDGREIIPLVRQPLALNPIEGDRPIYVSSIAQIQLVFPGPGKMTFETSINGIGLPLLFLYVNLHGGS